MNFDFYLFGTPNGYDQYPLDEKGELFQSFFDNNCPVQLTIYRKADLVYYTYIRNLKANTGSCFGMSLVFNGAYPSDLAEVFAVFDNLFDDVINKGRLLRKDNSGQIVFTGIRLADAQDEIEELTRHCRTLVENRLSRSETRLPDEYVVQERTASFAFDSNYLPSPLGELLKNYKRITLTKGKVGGSQTNIISNHGGTKWMPFVIAFSVLGLLVGAFLIYNSVANRNDSQVVVPPVSNSPTVIVQQEEVVDAPSQEPVIIENPPQQEEQKVAVEEVVEQNTNTSFPYDTYYLGKIGADGVLAIDVEGGGYCTYKRNDTDLTRNIKVDTYSRSTGRLIIKAYDRQGHYIGKLDGYVRNNNAYTGTFTIDSDNSILSFDLQAQPSDSDRSTGKYVVIDGENVRLRKGPSLNSDTYKWPDGHNRHPNKGERFRYLGEEGEFYKIDFNDTPLWVSKHHAHREN